MSPLRFEPAAAFGAIAAAVRSVPCPGWLLASLVLALGCAPSAVSQGPHARRVASSPPPVAAADPFTMPSAPRGAGPMAGEPAGSALTETRLVASSCDDTPAALTARIKRMRAEVDARFRDWHAAQPECWHQYYLEEQERQRQAREARFGRSGTSTASGQGFGSGYGRLGASHRAAPARLVMGSAVRSAVSLSGTNNQVVGVDEADIVKTDGRYVYLVAHGALRIVEALDPKLVSVTPVAGAVRDMFVEADRAVVYTSSQAPRRPCNYGYDCTFAGDGTSTRITVLDLRDRAHPRVARTLELSGSLMASRRIGRTVHTVVADGDSREPLYQTWPLGLATCGTREASVRAKFAQLKLENEQKIRKAAQTLPTLRDNGTARSLCGSLLRTALADGRAFTTIVSFDLGSDDAPPTTAMIQSRPGAVFASTDALYLSVVHRRPGGGKGWYSFYSSIDEASEVHKFRIGERPSATRYLGSGLVPGHVLNQFAMDEWNGKLRIATTRGRVPDPKVESTVSVLAEGEDHNLVRIGAIEHIAPGEDIRAVRFDGDRGYVVTFKKTDPLFVMDLKSPTRPTILGALHIPGFSTYLHRIDDQHLLSIGFDADDQGDFAYFDGLMLQLFDVTSPTDPKLLYKEKIGTRGSSSEAATNHLAFNYLAERHLLAIPATVCNGGGNGRQGKELSFSGLLIYDVSLARGFKRLGGIDHGSDGATCAGWWSRATSVVKRSVVLDDLVYSIADQRVKVQRLSALGTDVADISLTL